MKSPDKEIKVNIADRNTTKKVKKDKVAVDVREGNHIDPERKKNNILVLNKKPKATSSKISASSKQRRELGDELSSVNRKSMKDSRLKSNDIRVFKQQDLAIEKKKVQQKLVARDQRDTLSKKSASAKPSVKKVAPKRREEYSSDSDESDIGSDIDSDDSLDVEDREKYYSKNYSSLIQKVFGYDRNSEKYRMRDRQRMEPDMRSFEDREREENKSYRLGLKEDREEQLKEEMRKKKRKKS